MGKVSKARAEGIVKRIGVILDVEGPALTRIETAAAFLEITRSEMIRRILLASTVVPMDSELWNEIRKDRPRKIYREPRAPRRQSSENATA